MAVGTALCVATIATGGIAAGAAGAAAASAGATVGAGTGAAGAAVGASAFGATMGLGTAGGAIAGAGAGAVTATAAGSAAASTVAGATAVGSAIGTAAGSTGALGTFGAGIGLGSGPVGWLVLGAAEDGDQLTFDCWKPVIHDTSLEPSNGMLIKDIACHPNIARVTIETRDNDSLPYIVLENVWREQFEIEYFVIRDSGRLVSHAKQLFTDEL